MISLSDGRPRHDQVASLKRTANDLLSASLPPEVAETYPCSIGDTQTHCLSLLRFGGSGQAVASALN
jgi:hypothetical protein